MSAVQFRDRPVLTHIVEQHAEEAAFLWTLRDAATDAPHYKRHHLARLDERVEAHVDGLRVAGEAGWRITLEQLERRCEKGELFAASVLALESGDMRRIEPLLARAAAAEPAVRRGFVGAIAWCAPEVLAPTVRAWDRSAEGFERYLALCACSVHRAKPTPYLSARIDDRSALVRARALRLIGELGSDELRERALSHLEDREGDCLFWSAWSAVLAGDRASGLCELTELATGSREHSDVALEVGGRALGLEAGRRWAGVLAESSLDGALAIALVGYLGDVASVPWLIERLDGASSGHIAAESLSMITGLDVGFVGPGANAQDLGADLERHVSAQLDPAAFRSWWTENADRFSTDERYLLGSPISAAAWQSAWLHGCQRQRRAAAYERALSERDTTLMQWRRRDR